MKFLLPLLLIATCLKHHGECFAQGHSDVNFRYLENKLVIEPHDGRLVIPQSFPVEGFFQQGTTNPGFFSESDVNGGIGPGDVIVYNVLDDLLFWDDGEFQAVAESTFIRIKNNPSDAPETEIYGDSGSQEGDAELSRNSIGQADVGGEFHAHVDFQLAPKAGDAETSPAVGVYGLHLSLSSSDPTITESDPFMIAFGFGVDEPMLEQALTSFSHRLNTSNLPGDFNSDGQLSTADIDLLSVAVRQATGDLQFDVNNDLTIDEQDRASWVRDLANSLYGDADLDQQVAFSDFSTLSAAFGTNGGWGQGDFNGDGVIGFADFQQLSENFGQRTGQLSVVPEPSAAVLLILSTCAGFLGVRKGRNDRSYKARRKHGFTLVELLVVIAIIAMLVFLLLPAVQAARGAARKSQCTNNLRQLGLAFQSHHDARGAFPTSQLGSESQGDRCEGGMYSWHARILPYIEETGLHDAIDFSLPISDRCSAGSEGSISTTHPNARPAATEVAVFLCPSDGVTGRNDVVMGSANPASDNYAANAGWPASATGYDGEREPGKYNGLVTLQNPAKPSTALAKSPVRIRSVTDGLSKTAAIAERLIQPATDRDEILGGDLRLQSFHVTSTGRTLAQMASRCRSESTHAEAAQSAYVGRAWISGWSPTGATYRHLKSPNTNHCHFDLDFRTGDFAVTPSSDHPGGVNLAMADGHVRFVGDNVQPKIWWALGSRNAGDSINLE